MKARFSRAFFVWRLTIEINPLVQELAVTDLATSLRFYCGILGFSVMYERPEDGFAFLRLGEAQVMLDQIGQGRDFLAMPDHPFGQGLNLQIYVSALDPLIFALDSAGIPPFLPIETRWYRRGDGVVGQRQFIVTDPDGYLLRFAERLEAPEAGV